MRAILLQPNKQAEIIEVEDNYKKWKEVLGIDSPVSIIDREVENETYSFILDDEGLFKSDNLYGCGWCENAHEILVGSIIVSKFNKEGEMIDLSDADINNIFHNLYKLKSEELKVNYNTCMGVMQITFNNKGEYLVYGC